VQSYHAVGLFVHTHIFIMDFLFESNKAVPSVRIHMSLYFVISRFRNSQNTLVTRFSIFYPCYDINNRRRERHDINLRALSVRSCFLSLLNVGK